MVQSSTLSCGRPCMVVGLVLGLALVVSVHHLLAPPYLSAGPVPAAEYQSFIPRKLASKHQGHAHKKVGKSSMKTHVDEARPEDTTGVLMFKVARSGSTWMAGVVGRLHGVKFVQEAITHSAGQKTSTARQEEYLVSLLTQPGTGKIRQFSFRGKSLPDRDSEPQVPVDAEATYERAIGGSISPLASHKVNFHDILTLTKSKLVVYCRSNVVKRSVAEVRATAFVHKYCHSNNIRGSCGDKVPTHGSVPVQAFWNALKNGVHGNEYILDLARKARYPFFVMLYERLQADQELELRRLKNHLGMEWSGAEMEGIGKKDTTTKTTSDDLRHVVDNFDEIMAAVHSAKTAQSSAAEFAAIECIENMLNAATPIAFPECLPRNPLAKDSFGQVSTEFQGLRISLLQGASTGGSMSAEALDTTLAEDEAMEQQEQEAKAATSAASHL